MLKDIKNTTKHTTVYALGNIASKVVGILLLPIYTNEYFLSQEDFGALAILEATAQVLTALLSFAVANSLVRWYWDNKFKEKQKSIFFTVLVFLLAINIPVISVIVYKANFWADLIFGSSSYTYLLQLTFLAIFVRIFNTLIGHLIQLQSKSKFYALLNVLKLIVVLTYTIYAVTKLGRGLNGIWEATLLGELFAFILVIPFVLKNVRIAIEWNIFKNMLAFSYPLVLSNLAVITLTVTDRYMLHYMAGLAATGVYSLGLRLSNTLKLVITDSVMSALSPIRMKKINESSNHRFFSKVLTYTSFLFLHVLLLLSLFSLEVIKLITKTTSYWSASAIVAILSFAFLFSLMRLNFTTGLFIKKNTKILGLLTFVAAILNFGLNFLLIPIWDIYGAAAATLFSQFIFMFLTYYFAQKSYTIPYELKKLGIAVLVAALIVLIGIQLSEIYVVWRVVIKLVLFVSYPFVLLSLNFYDKVELENIKQILKSVRDFKKMKQGFKNFLS